MNRNRPHSDPRARLGVPILLALTVVLLPALAFAAGPGRPGLGRDGIGLNTDSPVVPEEQLPLQGAIAVRLGLPHEVALRALTINNATFAGIDHRVGSLEVGKDADLGIWSGDPIDPRSHVELMVVNGTICYRRDSKRPVF